ncbi:hypothetical protein OG417_21300 [Actinoallomurus sp. NBC_01490]|uniref:hypothetical protein n=1 Tax=Actinoallomurus sp. NBC_01490 TaxID=2903557 RepID=UPI002E32E49B|nr:hypothetical protein [Actinoallomurus sp. NBC_01490]
MFAAILTGATKTGRGAAGHTGKTLGRSAKNAVTSGYAATGWRTPGKALEHHAGRAGARIGQMFAGAARKVERHAATRWQDRQDLPPDKRPQMVRWLVDKPTNPQDGDDAGQTGPPPSFGGKHASRVRGSIGLHPDTAPDSSGGVVHTDPDSPWLNPATIQAIKAEIAAQYAEDNIRPDEVIVKPNGDIWIDRRKTTWWATPVLIAKWTPPAPNRPRQDHTSSDPSPNPASPDGPGRNTTTTGPRQGAEGSTATVARFGINLEPPTNDAEFLATLIDIGDALKAMAEEIEGWAESITGMGLPSSVTTPLHAIPEGITEAAQGAGRAASAFEDEFEDAREVASRGMKITGRDAA